MIGDASRSAHAIEGKSAHTIQPDSRTLWVYQRMTTKPSTEIGEYHLHPHQPGQLAFALHDLRSYLATNRKAATKPHIHSYHQLIWFTKGGGKHVVDLHAYDAIAGSVFFVARGQVHHFDGFEGYEGMLLHFNEEFLIRGEPGTDFLLKRDPFHGPHQGPRCLVGQEVAGILETYRALIEQELKHGDAAGREELLRAYVGAFLVQLHRAGRDPSAVILPHREVPADGSRTRLMRFVQLVETNYAKGHTIADYAQAMAMSARSLSALTARTLNKTPSQMVQERIILEAKRLLVHADGSVKEIGYRLGFADPSYFVKYFTKHVGLSPTAFRKAHAA